MHQPRLVLPLFAVGLAACTVVDPVRMDGSADSASPSPATSTQDPRPAFTPPPPPRSDAADWLRLKSGEWLRGELVVLRDGEVEFESDELDTLALDWDDVAELRTPRLWSILLDDGETLNGTLRIRDGEVELGGDAPRRLPRAELMAIVPAADGEAGHRSGKLSLGFTSRSGNTTQTDFSAHAIARRETPATRWDSTYNGAFSRVAGVETANNHREKSRFDWFVARHLYLTPAGVDVFRDTFQNIAWRVTPYAAVGYDLVDTGKVTWSVSAGPAYQHTVYDSVPPGDDRTDTSAAGVLQSRFEWDITSDVGFDLDDDLTVPVPATQRYNHHLAAILSVELIGDFDLDVSAVWDRVNDPSPSDDGSVPHQDDFRTTIGVGYDFGPGELAPGPCRGGLRSRCSSPTMRALLATLLILGGDGFTDGVRAYREGRFEDALQAFAAAEVAAGDGAPAELLYDRALAALRVGRLREAEFSAEKTDVRGGGRFAGFRDFVFGSAAFVRCERAAAEAGLQDPDPTAFARAIAHAEAARDAWVGAATSRADWPEARRNVERAQRMLDDLRAKKAAADASRRSRREGQAKERPDEPGPDAKSEEVEQAQAARPDEGAMSADQIERLLARLAQKEQEKRALRRARQEAPSMRAERDW